jgi:hypothetical protein
MKVIIIHGIADNEKDKDYNQYWLPWIKEKLEEKRIECINFLMPEPWNPKYKDWKKEFEKVLIDEGIILIGHSAGCAFLVRWFGETKKKIRKLILVAPWKISSEEFSEGENEMYDYEIENCVRENVGETIIFTSNDEDEDGKESVNIFHNALGGKIIELKNYGHFDSEMVTEKFPELLEKVLE